MTEGERLQKVMARAGVGSRRASEEMIAAGRVTVNGDVAVLGARVDPATDHVELDGVTLIVDETLVFWLLNNPAAYATTARDPQGRATVFDLVPSEPRVFTVGRLDLDSEGLLILTNDGELAQLLTHPRHHVEKEYFVEVDGVPKSGALRTLREGVDLDDGRTLPAQVRLVQSSAHGTSALEIVVREGRKRMVRRMCSSVGHPVVRLVRTRIGPLRDPALAPGAWRTLTPAEVRTLYAASAIIEGGPPSSR